jgi:hypothetical protein
MYRLRAVLAWIRGALVLVHVCLSPKVFRVLSVFCQYHGGTNVDGAIWNNGLLTHAPACRRPRWRRREVCEAQAIRVAWI